MFDSNDDRRNNGEGYHRVERLCRIFFVLAPSLNGLTTVDVGPCHLDNRGCEKGQLISSSLA